MKKFEVYKNLILTNASKEGITSKTKLTLWLKSMGCDLEYYVTNLKVGDSDVEMTMEDLRKIAVNNDIVLVKNDIIFK